MPAFCTVTSIGPETDGMGFGLARMLRVMDLREDDAELMLRYQAGDAPAFDTLYARHKGPLYRYLLRQVGSASTANDLFQEVWMRIIASRQRYTPRARFATFLFRIAHNCAVDHHRRAPPPPVYSKKAAPVVTNKLFPPPHNRPPPPIAPRQRLSRLERALHALPEEQREAFLLHEESGLDVAQIAQITEVGVETAKSRLRYAIGKLRRSLAESDERVAQAG